MLKIQSHIVCEEHLGFGLRDVPTVEASESLVAKGVVYLGDPTTYGEGGYLQIELVVVAYSFLSDRADVDEQFLLSKLHDGYWGCY